MATNVATGCNRPLPFFLRQNTCKILSFKNEKALLSRFSVFEFGQKNSITWPEYVESFWFIFAPLSVHIFAVGEVDEGGAVEFVAMPVRDMEGEIVVNEDANSLSLFVADRTLVLAVTVVYYIGLHDIIYKKKI